MSTAKCRTQIARYLSSMVLLDLSGAVYHRSAHSGLKALVGHVISWVDSGPHEDLQCGSSRLSPQWETRANSALLTVLTIVLTPTPEEGEHLLSSAERTLE